MPSTSKRMDPAERAPAEINVLRLLLLAGGGFAVVWALLTFAVDSLPGEWVTGAAILIFGVLTLTTGIQLRLGVRNRDLIGIIVLGMSFLLLGGALVEQEWITPLFMVIPIALLLIAFTGNGKRWFEAGRRESSTP